MSYVFKVDSVRRRGKDETMVSDIILIATDHPANKNIIGSSCSISVVGDDGMNFNPEDTFDVDLTKNA